MNRLQSITAPDPDGSGPLAAAVTRLTHDAAGNLTKVVDPLSRTTTWGYDEANRMVHQSRGEHWSLDKRYDAAGQEVQVLGPAADHDNPDYRMVTTKGYDPRGNLISTSDSLMWIKASQFNALGELSGFT